MGGVILLVFLFFYGEYTYITYRLGSYRKEEDILLGLMKTVQRECFDEKKMSMAEYSEAMLQYERNLNVVVKKTVELESKKANLLKFGRDEARLKHESKRLFELIKETQKRYMDREDLETRGYEDKMKSFTSRLGEVEEQLATIEAQKAIKKKGFFGGIRKWFGK